VGMLSEMFLADTPRRLAALREALGREDAQALAREAHTLLGTCASLGARRMAGVCEELQALGRAGDLAPATRALDRLETEFGHVRAALNAEEVRV